MSNRHANKDDNRESGIAETSVKRARRHRLLIELAREALISCAASFAFALWKIDAWWLRCAKNYSWDRVERILKRHGVEVGWRRIRHAVSEVAAYLREELLTQRLVISEYDSPTFLNFEQYYKRKGDTIRVYLPGTECDGLFRVLYAYLLATELAGQQSLKRVEDIPKKRGRIVVLKIVED